MTEIRVKRQYGDSPQLVCHEREHPNFEARLAIDLLERWGLVAGEEAGEDSAGRAKIRSLTPPEAVIRACDMAEEMTKEIRNRGWFVAVPSWDEMEEQVQREQAEERVARDTKAYERRERKPDDVTSPQ